MFVISVNNIQTRHQKYDLFSTLTYSKKMMCYNKRCFLLREMMIILYEKFASSYKLRHGIGTGVDKENQRDPILECFFNWNKFIIIMKYEFSHLSEHMLKRRKIKMILIIPFYIPYFYGRPRPVPQVFGVLSSPWFILFYLLCSLHSALI